MYCVRCGVELADTEKTCPLCGTIVFHPDITRPPARPLYPPGRPVPQQVSPWGALFILSALFLIPIAVTLVCDISIAGRITWSGYAVGALLTGYVICVLPFWFKRPNPVIFVPVDFAAVGCYLLYIDLATAGGWFLSFALPVTAAAGLIVTAVVTLTRYIRRGRLYIYGGMFIAVGAFMLLLEFLLNVTFQLRRSFIWAFYPLTVLVLLGALLLVIAICRPLRQALYRKFFI